MEVAVGLLLVVLGAVGAAMATRSIDDRGRPWVGALAIAPMGLLVGAGAALVRDWDLVPTAAIGLVALPAVHLASRVRWQRRGEERR